MNSFSIERSTGEYSSRGADDGFVAILGSPKYLRRGGVPRRLGDLARHDGIVFRLPGTGTPNRWQVIEDGKLLAKKVAGAVVVNDTAAMRDCARAGLGLACALERTAAEPEARRRHEAT